MGLIVPQTVKVRTNGRTCEHYREKGYTFEKCGDFIEVDVFDLPKSSHEMVKIICDVCGKESKICYKVFIENRKKGILVSCKSNSCANKKREDTCIKKHGVKHVMQLEEVKDKIKDTNLKRHGCENPMQNKEIQNKAKNTCIKRYNVDNPSKAQEIKDKKKNTCQLHFKCDWSFQNKEVRERSIKTWQKNYGEGIINPGQAQAVKDKIKATWKNNYGKGIENPFQVESVKEKSKQTMLKNHGVESPMQSEEIKNKVLSSFQFHGTGPSSRAQRYINYILNGTLNKHICGSLADIYIEKENIVIEHDGSGHFLTDKFNGNETPTKESLLYEKEREDKIINNGYRMIRFIAAKDRIPSDEVILNLIEGFKNSDFKVIRINFEEGTIDRDYEEKWYCNFGKLRNITQKDLEQFEKQEENTSEN